VNGQQLKEQGQSRSVAALSAETWDAFALILGMFEPGARLSVNDIRHWLDWGQIPDSARGGLFAQAVRKGLLVPVTTADGFEVRVKSTGLSAHRATCRLYRRAP
jgi:hypothetical protein